MKKYISINYWFIYIGVFLFILAFWTYPNREEAIFIYHYGVTKPALAHVKEIYLYGMFRSLVMAFLGIGLIVIGSITISIKKT